MSKSQEVEVVCPACRQRVPFFIWDSINVQTDPGLRNKVLTDKIFEFHCRSCGHTANLFYPFLYHDMEHRFWIQVVVNPKDDLEHSPVLSDIAFKTMTGYRSRLVSLVNEMKEKIWIFENGLDDRVIEALKLHIENKDETVAPLWFYELERDERGRPVACLLAHIEPSGKESLTPVDWEEYINMQEWMFMSMREPEQEPLGWARVDKNYALHLFSK